jgi:monoamine oxidase
MSEIYDVIVVGGGLSGLAAADRLSKNGNLRLLVLEASERFGGRTLTVESKDGGAHDLGGHWLAPSQHLMHNLCRQLGVGVKKQRTEGHAVMDQGAKIVKYKGTVPPIPLISQAEVGIRAFWQLERMAKEVAGPDGVVRINSKNVEAWDGQTLETWKQQSFWTQPAKDLLDVAVRMVWGCECKDISLLHALYDANISGGFAQLVDVEGAAQDSYIEGGSQQVSERLAEGVASRDGCRCLLQAPVHLISHGPEIEMDELAADLEPKNFVFGSADGQKSEFNQLAGKSIIGSPQQEVRISERPETQTSPDTSGRVDSTPASTSQKSVESWCATVHSAKGVFTAKSVIIALAPTMINRHIKFEPPLPSLREQMGARYFMGSYTKAIVCYAKPFWRAKGFSGEAMGAGYSRELPVLMSFDVSDEDGGHAALACFITGDPADDHCALSSGEQKAGVIRSLVRFFGEEARDFREIHIKVWTGDPWTR